MICAWVGLRFGVDDNGDGDVDGSTVWDGVVLFVSVSVSVTVISWMHYYCTVSTLRTEHPRHSLGTAKSQEPRSAPVQYCTTVHTVTNWTVL